MLQPGKPPEVETESRYVRGARILVETCAGLVTGERALILSNPETVPVAKYVAAQCHARHAQVRVMDLEPTRIHGEAPPAEVGAAMLWADVVFCLTSMSMAHTAERKRANEKGTRFLSLPDYSLALLESDSLCCDFHQAARQADHLQKMLNGAQRIHVQTRLGTDLTFSAAGRLANACPGLCLQPGSLGSPPDAEVNIAPLEPSAEGTVVVDGSIPCKEIGRLTQPVTLELHGGHIEKIRGTDASIVATLERLFERVGNHRARCLAEFGIGLNPAAQLTGRMLDDEGCAGTIHLGFGSNATIGGINHVPFHLDFVLREPTVTVDGQRLGIPQSAESSSVNLRRNVA